MDTSGKRIAIVGSGAIGLYYGARLAELGEDVRFLLRSDYDVVQRDGIRVESIHGDVYLPKVQGFRSSEEIGPVDLVIVGWKTTCDDQFPKVLPPLLHEKTQVLTLQNGLGSVEALSKIIGADRVMGGLCFVCINRIGPGHVSHTAGGRVTIGEAMHNGSGHAEFWTEKLRQAKVPAEAVENLDEARWKKLVWNVPFNGLAIAEGGKTTDQLLASPEIETEIRGLMAEVIAAARALGYVLEDSLIDFNVERTRPMAAYKPSSMIDYVEGREVEVETLWAEPVRRAQAAGVPVPRMEKLLGRIRQRIAER